MLRVIFIVLAVAVLAYLGLCAVGFIFQRSLIYFPQPRSIGGDATTVELQVGTERVIVSTRPHDGPKALIYFGGNAEDVSLNIPEFSAAFPDRAIYLLHYRGYGGSSGKPSEQTLVADGLALFDEVHKRHQDIVIVGRSLGSGIAVHVASLRPVERLVLVTPYDSLQDIAAHHYPYFPVRWLLLDKYESWRYAPAVKAPTLIIAAEHDEIIPRASSELLQSRFAAGVAAFRVIPGTNHNTISGSPEYMPLLKGGNE
jgi:pimeloyl-ACP methyl ester carboxylesterase